MLCPSADSDHGCTPLETAGAQTGVGLATIYRCPPGVCEGGSNVTGTEVCRKGHFGPACALCKEGYGMKGRRCEMCGGEALGQTLIYYVLFPLVGFAFILIWYWFALKPLVSSGGRSEAHAGAMCLSCCALPICGTIEELILSLRHACEAGGSAKIVIGFAQVFGSMLNNLAVDWPSKIVTIMEWATVLQFQFVSMPGAGCLLKNISYFARLMAQTLFPVVIVFLLALPSVYVILAGIAFHGGHRNHPKFVAVVDRFIQSVLIVMFIVFPSVCAATLSTFRCTDYGSDGLLLDVDHTVDCRSDEYHAMRLWASVCVVLYPIGIPAFFLGMMLREGVRTIAKEKADEARLEAMLVLWKRQTSSNLKNSLAVTFGSDVNEHFDRRVHEMFKFGMEVRGGLGHSRSSLCPRRLRHAIARITQIPEAHLPHEQVESLFEEYAQAGLGLKEGHLHTMMRDIIVKQSMFTGQERSRELSVQQLLFLHEHDWARPIPRALAHTEEELDYHFRFYNDARAGSLAGRAASLRTASRANSRRRASISSQLRRSSISSQPRSPQHRRGSVSSQTRRGSVSAQPGRGSVSVLEPDAGESVPVEPEQEAGARLAETVASARSHMLEHEEEMMSEKELRSWLHDKAIELQAKQRIAVSGTLWKDDGDEREQKAIRRLGFLFLSYKVEAWWFELALVFYKLAMSSFVIFFWSGTPSQVAAAFLITLVCLVLHLFRSPYVNQELFRMQVYSLVAQTVNLFLGMMMISGTFSDAIGRDKDDTYLSGFMVALNLMVFLLPVFLLLVDGRGMYIRYKSNQVKIHRMIALGHQTHPSANAPSSTSQHSSPIASARPNKRSSHKPSALAADKTSIKTSFTGNASAGSPIRTLSDAGGASASTLRLDSGTDSHWQRRATDAGSDGPLLGRSITVTSELMVMTHTAEPGLAITEPGGPPVVHFTANDSSASLQAEGRASRSSSTQASSEEVQAGRSELEACARSDV
mmetsp:Transcript_22749/g.34625  ORF Transcript_22749/g.34625 Transcript_22749/m.34625 type:complete len:983 (+) Transcript_22749:852-3800(+)